MEAAHVSGLVDAAKFDHAPLALAEERAAIEVIVLTESALAVEKDGEHPPA
jgi:hypothetical protein